MERKKFILSLPLVALFIISFISAFSLYQNSEQQSFDARLFLQKKLPLSKFTFQDLHNQNQSLTNNDLIGQYSLISVFASWCTTCSVQHQILMELYRQNSINIYGISWKDIDDNTIKYLKDNGNPYKKVGIDGKGVISKILSVDGVPESFITNQDGEVIYKHQGVMDRNFLNIINNLPPIVK